MPRKKATFKGGGPVARIGDYSSPTRPHVRQIDPRETFIGSVIDYTMISHATTMFLDVFTSGWLALDLGRNDPDLEDGDIYYDDDDDDDDEYDDIYSHNVTHRPLEPHPRIRQLTDQEADKHAKQLLEGERCKDKTERNKRKKLRKKEKKRLEKENAVKENAPEEENGNSDSAENCEDISIIYTNAEANAFPESGKAQPGSEEVGYDESGANNYNNKEENNTEMTKKEDGKQKNPEFNTSCSTAESVPAETYNQRPARARKKGKTKLVEVKQSDEQKPKLVEKSEVQKKEDKLEPNKQNTMDHMAEELVKRSRELAGLGNSFAASGQYETAVKYFTDAIKCNPEEFKLFGNRSFCYERLQQYENALRDADLVLCMEPKWIKGLFRKGKALCGLQRYYEASLIYKEVLQLQSTSVEAMQELKRAQILHLMEMGFTWEQSAKALKSHASLEEAVESLFDDCNEGSEDASASRADVAKLVVQEEDEEVQWTVHQTNRIRMQQLRETDASPQSRLNSELPIPRPRNSVKPELYSVWVGFLAPAVTYTTLHELFSRTGTVHSIKMLLEHQFAFVNYSRMEDCDKAIQCINGMVLAGTPLLVRYPHNSHTGVSTSKEPLSCTGPYSKGCFFWRTTGCTRLDCTYKHDPKHKNIDRDKVTSRLGDFHK